MLIRLDVMSRANKIEAMSRVLAEAADRIEDAFTVVTGTSLRVVKIVPRDPGTE